MPLHPTQLPARPTAKPANRNAVRHGLRAGSLPKGASYIERETTALRRIIEEAVADANAGNVSLMQAAYINSAVKYERHGMLCQRWLRMEAGSLTPDQRLAFSREVARASSERDKCLERLGLNRGDVGDMLDALYAPPAPASAATGPHAADNAENGSGAANDTPNHESPAIARVGNDTGDANK